MRRIASLVLFIVMASIDNTALALLPALTPSIGNAFGVGYQLVGTITGINLLVVAVTALVWGYRSDQVNRKGLLILGTLAWAAPLLAVPFSPSFGVFLGLMLVAGVGLGCISTVGYTLVTDLVAPQHRGLLLGVWGLAQGLGGLLGGIMAGIVVPFWGWSGPFWAIAALGFGCSALAVFAISPRKGGADQPDGLPSLTPLPEYRIALDQLPLIWRKPTNRYLMLQGVIAQFGFGSLTWLTVLLTSKLTVQNVGVVEANSTAAIFASLLQLGGVLSLGWGWLGDRLQQREKRSRGLLAAAGFWIGAPLFVILFWLPLPIDAANASSGMQLLGLQIGRNPWWWLTMLVAILAVGMQGANAPNWYALVSEVNLPEHRGTAFGLLSFASSVGRALGTVLVGLCFGWLQNTLPAPQNYALGLSLFQLFFLPAGLCFWLAARSTSRDAAQIQAVLRERQQSVTRFGWTDSTAPAHLES